MRINSGFHVHTIVNLIYPTCYKCYVGAEMGLGSIWKRKNTFYSYSVTPFSTLLFLWGGLKGFLPKNTPTNE